MASATDAPRVGVGGFYEALWVGTREAVTRWHLDLALEGALIAAWFLIRTVASVDSRAYLLWVVAVGLVAIVTPRSGLVVFVATSVFYEPDSLVPSIAPRELIVLPLALGVMIQVVADRFRWRPGPAIWLALVLLAGTALGVVHTFREFDQVFQWRAAQAWIGNMLAPIVVLVAAAWTARDGSVRVLVVATGVGVVAALVALLEYAAPGSVSTGPLAWVGYWKDFLPRLAGIVPSPNAMSTLLIVPTMVLAAAVVLAGDLRLRAIALVALIPVVIAQYLTFSRAPFLAATVFVVIVAWRFRRWVGIAVLVLGLAAGALALPVYLGIRSSTVPGSDVQTGSILVASDVERFTAWGAAIGMIEDQPIVGQGYLAYKALAGTRTATRSWVRRTTSGCGSSPRRA